MRSLKTGSWRRLLQHRSSLGSRYITFVIIIYIQVMRRAQSNSPRLPSKNQYHEEARLSHLLLLPDHASSHPPARPPSYPAATPSHAQRERAEFQLRQLGANIPRIRVSCEPRQAQMSQLLPGQGQENRGRSPGRSGAWDSEVERQTPKPRLELYHSG